MGLQSRCFIASPILTAAASSSPPLAGNTCGSLLHFPVWNALTSHFRTANYLKLRNKIESGHCTAHVLATSCKPVRICSQHTFLFFREASIYLRRITGTSVRCLEEIFIRQRVRNVADLPVYWIPLGKFCWTLYLLVIRVKCFLNRQWFCIKSFQICRDLQASPEKWPAFT